jgi:hypothetical protein
LWKPLNKEIKRKEALFKELTQAEEISEVVVDENGDEWEDIGNVAGERCCMIQNFYIL